MIVGTIISVCSYPSLAFSSIEFPFSSSSSFSFDRKIVRPSSCINLSGRCNSYRKRKTKPVLAVTESSRVMELDSSSEPIEVFDGTIRLYISYTCPFAQRAWITRNYKGLQEKIQLVPIDLKNRPVWYKEKVYSANKVDVAYVPFIERYQLILKDIAGLDIAFGRPNLSL